MSLFPLNQGAGPSGFGYRSTAEAVTHGLDLSGKTYLVTGCSTGLGRETLRVLTLRGACVIALARTLENARKVCAQVAGDTVPLACELSDPGSINRAIDEVRKQQDVDIVLQDYVSASKRVDITPLVLEYLKKKLDNFSRADTEKK